MAAMAVRCMKWLIPDPCLQIGRQDYHDSADYLLRRAGSIQQLASSRPDLSVEVLPLALQSKVLILISL